MPSVSVLMPCYNAAGTLAETLDSLLAQGHADFEIVAVDDGSTDGSADILADYARQDARLQPLYRPHAGIIAALNAGLNACRGEFVARMDADDLAPPQRLELQAQFLEAHPDVALVASLVEGFPKTEIREGFRIYIDWLNSLRSDAEIKREIFVESPLAHPSVMFRKQAVLDLGAYQEHGWPEDYDLWLRMAQAGLRFVKIPEILLQWRDHPPRLTRTDSRYSVENFLRAKSHYLMKGPMRDRDALFIWGAGMMGKRLSKHLLRAGAPLEYFIDVDPAKIGRTRRSKPIIAPDDLLERWQRFEQPILLAAVGARGARKLIREKLEAVGLSEGRDWFAAA